jgi:hypothetical protein
MNASDSEEPRDIEKRPKPADKKKGKNLKKRSADVPKDQDSDDDSDESWKGRKIVVSRPPRPDIGKMDPVHEPENVKKRREVQSTGELYDPPCSHCQALKIDCEKPDVGTACVKCRNVKHRCEYAQRVKGKETTKAVEAEDEEGKAKGRKKRPDAASEDEEGKTKGKKRRVPDASEDETEAPTVVPTRHAAKAATQAIQDILTAVTPPRQTSLPKKIKGSFFFIFIIIFNPYILTSIYRKDDCETQARGRGSNGRHPGASRQSDCNCRPIVRFPGCSVKRGRPLRCTSGAPLSASRDILDSPSNLC